MTINGADYTLPVFVIGSMLILFGLQFFFCNLKKWRWLRFLPSVYVVLLLVLAAVVYFSSVGKGFFDLSAWLALLLCCYAAFCALAVCLAWVIYRWKNGRGSFLQGVCGK